MSRIIAVVNPKEGVGKTTTALNLAQAFALGGQGALLLDFDSNEGISSHLGVARPRSGLFARILRGEEESASIGLLVRSVVAGLDVVPSDITDPDSRLNSDAGEHLREALEVLRFQYPWSVIDCPSNLDDWTRAAVEVADTIIIPVEAELFARESTARILEFAKKLRGATPQIKIVLNKFRDRNSLSADVKRDLSFEYPRMFSPTIIPQDKQTQGSREAGKSLLQYALESRASRAYIQLAKEVMTHD